MGLPHSGMAAGPPQLTLQPIAAASWQTENSGMTTSSPSTVWPAIARAAIFSASRWASGNHDPVASISPWQAIDVPVPNTGWPDVFLAGDRVEESLSAHGPRRRYQPLIWMRSAS